MSTHFDMRLMGYYRMGIIVFVCRQKFVRDEPRYNSFSIHNYNTKKY